MQSNLSKKLHIEKSISLFDSKSDYQKSVALFKQFGQCEHKLLKHIYYESSESEMGKKQAPISDSLELLERFGLLFKTECTYIENKVNSYFQVVLPLACLSLYESGPQPFHSSWEECLFGSTFELYFLRLDQIRQYWNECKEFNALRKEKMLWASREGPIDNEFYNYFECDLSAGNSKLFDEDLNSRNIKHNICDSDGNFCFHNELELLAAFTVRTTLELISPFIIPRCFFARFAINMQPLIAERFDWADAFIGRDLNGTCVRALFNSQANLKILIEIKAKQIEFMNEMKESILALFDDIENYYPGLYFFQKIRN